MRRRDFLTLAGAAATTPAWPLAGLAQVPVKVPRVALVTGAGPIDEMQIGKDVTWSAFLARMATNGFVEGRTVFFDRYLLNLTTGTDDANAEKVLTTTPDAIFWLGTTPAALAALALNNTVPMVVETGDLLAQGVVSNLAHPGGNATGVSATSDSSIEGKRLALLAEAVPTARTFAYTNSGANGQFNPVKAAYLKSVGDVAAKLGLTMIPIVFDAGGGDGVFLRVFEQVMAAKAQMVVLGTDTSLGLTAQQSFVAKLALDARIPTISQTREFADVGGLLGQGASRTEIGQHCADYVAMVLQGAKPGDLPVLQPTVFDFVVNLKTAKAIGITIPQSLLLQATEVIT